MLPLILISIMLILSYSFSLDREKSSPYECGFNPMNNARIPFSLRFFILAVLFLVFDIEIVILLPSPLSLLSFNSVFISIPFFGFIIILILGLFHEWNEGSLSWSKFLSMTLPFIPMFSLFSGSLFISIILLLSL